MWSREELVQYLPGMNLSNFYGNKIPLLLMEHLRQLDYTITRGISYERTVYAFLAQIELLDSLRFFKSCKNAVVLLNEEGAMIREDYKWYLLFSPETIEQMTLDLDSDLYPVYTSVMNKLNEGTICKIGLSDVSIKSLLNNKFDLCILDKYCKIYPGGYVAVAQKIVTEGTTELFKNVPSCCYGALKTVDIDELESYHSIKSLLDDYIYQVENSDDDYIQPLSISVFGTPGSGKSFGVKQIAKSCGKFDITTLNLSQYNDYNQMIVSLDQSIKNSKKIPLIFFDEFDSEYEGVSRGWLKYLLAPMQDGEYTIDGKIHKIKNAVFVFAGGTATSFKKFLPSNPDEEIAFKHVKGPDFISRLKGMLNIKGPNPVDITDRAYVIRRAILMRDMLVRKFPSIYNKEDGSINISTSLLSALLRTSQYRHGTRSIEFIFDMSRLAGVKKFTPSCLPIMEQLDIHLDTDDFNKKIAFERIGENAVIKYMSSVHKKMCEKRINDAINRGASEAEINSIKSEKSMQPWEMLNEEYKESYRNRLRFLIEYLSSIDFPIGIRPHTTYLPDSISELYGTALDDIARIEHESWLVSMKENGWKYGKRLDEELRISPMILNYDDLTSERQEEIQLRVRSIPRYLESIGFELFKKPY